MSCSGVRSYPTCQTLISVTATIGWTILSEYAFVTTYFPSISMPTICISSSKHPFGKIHPLQQKFDFKRVRTKNVFRTGKVGAYNFFRPLWQKTRLVTRGRRLVLRILFMTLRRTMSPLRRMEMIMDFSARSRYICPAIFNLYISWPEYLM